ncbi:unnamed protein product [Symbiodinium natans]|uniref:Uncharacterized protein n=1 Tax=Symbiodinium natans TaxID=878477 RepID=A0A812L5V0_9DINO|nr:unnamed protein product [Symbiodinium natans]
MLSVSTFVSSTASETPLASQTAREFRRPGSTWPEMMPEAILFPANKPTSRADAQVLARWVSASFQTYAKRSKHADSKELCEEDLTKMVQELVPVLSIGLNEVVRQVSQHCLERGVVLEKIWRTYVELFEQALGESREALRRQKDKTAKAEAELQRVREEAAELKVKHPAQLEKLRQTLTTKFDQRQNELVQQLTSTRSENRALKVHLEEQLSKQHAWFPMFAVYKESRYRRALLGKAVAELPKAASVEARLASDFRRILSSLPADVRRRVGFFISSLLGFRGVGLSAVTSEALQERKELNAKKIKELKAKLRQLKGEDTSESSEDEDLGEAEEDNTSEAKRAA